MSTTAVIPPEYAAFVDDAAVFPPGNAHLGDAVRDHRENAAAPYAALVGPFVVSDVRLPDLLEVLTLSPGEPLPVTVVVTGGAGGLEPASRWASGSDLLELRSLEIALRDLDDLPGNARRVAAAAGAAADVPVYVEPPLSPDVVGGHGWSAALDVVAEHELRLTWRTGAATADLVPSAQTMATALEAALDRELPFACTGGLHRAVRQHDDATGFDHHGFLNVLLATRVAFDGAGMAEVVSVLDERDAGTVRDRVVATGSGALARARAWFTSFACGAVLDPLEDLLDLGLVHVGTPRHR